MNKITYLAALLLSLLFYSVSSVLAVSYIELDAYSLDLNFKSGDSYPIIRLVNARNISQERVRFDISSNAPWIFVYREGQPGNISLEVPPGANLNFVLEIHAEQAPDGRNTAQALIKAVSLAGYSTLETAEVNVNLNKNFVPTSPTPTSVLTPSPSTTPLVSRGQPTPASLGFTSLSAISLKEGDTVSSAVSGDPDIYIVNEWGYKRLFLNPVIFGFYGHLGGFTNVRNVPLTTRNILVPSGLFRNCEINDPKVYGLETTGEDTGVLRWINTSGEQAVADDPDFFKRVFCINNNEFSWYQKGADYTSVSQAPLYFR